MLCSFSESMNIIVTGSSKGLGASLAQQLLAQGHSVVGISRTSSPPELKNHDKFYHFPIDLVEENSSEMVIQGLKRNDLVPNAIIFNAAKYDIKRDYAIPYLKAAGQLNFVHPIELVKALKMEFGEAPIVAVLISSVMIFFPDHLNYVYASTKAGVSNAFTNLRWNSIYSNFRFKTFYLGPFDNSTIRKFVENRSDVSKVAQYIIKSLSKPGHTYFFPNHYKLLCVLSRFVPDGLLISALKKFRR